jgi:AraC-like DNA-binding protein
MIGSPTRKSSDSAADSAPYLQPRQADPEYAPEDMRSLVGSSFCTMSYHVVPGVSSPMTGFRGVGLGAVDVFRHEGIGKRFGSREPDDIRNHWVDDFVISMPLDARVTTRQRGHVAELEPGSFVFLSTSRPFGASLAGANPQDPFSAFLVRISGPLLRERAPLLDECCGLPLRTNSGSVKIMQTLFDLALAEGTTLSQTQLARFSDLLFTAITNVALEISETSNPRPLRQRAPERVREEAIAYIHRNLSNPGLSPRQVAQHCKVSERYLQTAFAAVATTMVGFIRETRLMQCRASLMNPGLRHTSIIDIALRWGFNDASYFSRAYKVRFGKSPSAERG